MAGTFRPNRQGIAVLARAPEMTRHMRRLAQAGAAEVEAAAPHMVKHRGSSIHGEASNGEGRIIVQSPFWHIDEYGTVNNAPSPYIRPTVARFLSRIGGRFVGR